MDKITACQIQKYYRIRRFVNPHAKRDQLPMASAVENFHFHLTKRIA